ncbi:lysophospholipid acyltransferase family protein [Stenotrophomonas rhizophila]|nr:lysophospholipid acyltransferase family protein [Stenotrophomonas rhizophila]MCC7662025.1 lysophospholipid acyltransferase family protein [Stenotrophomonas rhizophila]
MNNQRPLLPAIPPNMPQVKPNRFIRWLARCTLRLGGWRVVGTFPDVPKLVFIIAPHSSNWDGFWGMAAKIALGMQVKVLGKASLFWWPLAPLLRKLGVIPLDRSSPQGTVEQAVSLIRGSERMWYALTPEGTRKAVTHWKAGFLKIARMADVPVLAAYFHYPEKVIGIGPLFYSSGDDVADMAAIRAYYRPWQGKNRGTA